MQRLQDLSERPSDTLQREEDDFGDLDAQFNASAVDLTRKAAMDIAQDLLGTFFEEQVEYAFRGLGGGGISRFSRRSDEVRDLRNELKTAARHRAAVDLQTLIRDGTGPKAQGVGPASQAYFEMMGANVAAKLAKSTVDDVIRSMAEKLVDQSWFTTAMTAMTRAALAHLQQSSGDTKGARTAAARALKPHKDTIHARVKAAKNAITGKEGGSTEVGRDQRQTLKSDTREKVSNDKVASNAIQMAIDAPSMSAGLWTLKQLIDNAIPNSGESVQLKVDLTIPAGPGGVVVVIGVSASAARGIDGATTSGVTKLGDPKRVEISADFSVGVGAEWVGVKAAGAVKFFVRAGANAGTEAALHALSYAAYRTASRYSDGLANLWVQRDVQGNRSIERAEVWAAMIEEQIFDDGDAFADTGMGIDGTVDVNLAVAELGGGIGASRFTHYDKKALEKAYGKSKNPQSFGKALPKNHRRGNAELKRLLGKQVKRKHSFRANFHIKADIGIQSVGLSASFSGSAKDNFGGEITAEIGMPANATDPTTLDKIVNGWTTGLGEMLKKLKTAGDKHETEDNDGMLGYFAQFPQDGATVFDAGMANQVRNAIANIGKETVAKGPYSTPVGQTPSVGDQALEKVSSAVVSSKLQFALAIGVSSGDFVCRFELRSVRGFSVGAPSVIKVEGTKTSRLLALGTDGGTEKPVAEVLGVRLDNSGNT